MLLWLVLVGGYLVLVSLDLVLPLAIDPRQLQESGLTANCGWHLLVDNSPVASCSTGLGRLRESSRGWYLVSTVLLSGAVVICGWY